MIGGDMQAASAAAFDPAQWLADFATLGGGYVHTGERVAFLTAGVLAPDLAVMMRQIVGKPDRLDAVKAEVAARTMEVTA